jgi:photosystem II stability/assembly factor-like uncharacterized protein
MIKKIGILLFLISSFLLLKAQELECDERIETNQTTPLVQVGDNKTISCGAGQPGATDLTTTDIVTLAINFNHPDFVADAYLLEVDVEITPLSGTPFTIPLTIEYEPFDKQTYKDKDAFIFKDVDEYVFEIAGIKVNGNTITDLPSNAYLDGSIRVNRIFDFTPYTGTAITVNPPVEIDLDCDAMSTPDEIDINWVNMTGAIEYQLEWAFINDYDATVTANNSIPNNVSPTLLKYDFRHNSTRVTTIEPHYIIPLLFERGYLIYRVRAVGIDPNQPDKFIYGVWSTPNSTGDVNTLLAINHAHPTTSHENLKNWQLTTNFAEEGKRKEVISYFDGSLRNRQSVTKINSYKNENVIVGETIYDHQGRAAVSVLPVPVLEDSCTSPTIPPIKFYPNFNRDSSGTVGYSKANFDVDVADCETAVQPMFDETGASLYYSPNNPKQDAQQKFVPDANRHPFTVIDYTSDQTGRIRKQSGVGENFKLGSGHETKYFYGKPDQIQLDRLFGSEVGFASHYKKNMVIDANNQISVSYLNQEGKVVATSLAGNPPTNVEPIPSYDSAAVNLEQEMILPTAANTTPAGKVNQMLLNETFLVTSAGPYVFNYDMESVAFTDTCLPNICFTCAYELTVKLTDDCGNVITDTLGNPIEYHDIIGNFTDNGNDTITFHVDCNVTTPNHQLSFVADLLVGNYNIEKTLTLSENAIDYYLEQYLDSNNNTCIKTLHDFEEEFLAQIDSSDCNITCESCAEALGTKEDFVAYGFGTAADYDLALEECNAPCKLLTMCETNYQMLLADVSPGGQYGQFQDANGNTNVGMYWLSVFNTTSTNELNLSGSANWKNPKLFLNSTNQIKYVDDNDDESFIQVTETAPGVYSPTVDNPSNIINNGGQLFISPQHLANVDDFIKVYWKDSWARSLVQYHPEYCYYEQCLGHMEEDSNHVSSQLFDARLRDFSFSDAVGAGYLNGTDAVGYTFDYTVNDPFISFTSAANYKPSAANELIDAFNNSFVIDGQMRNMTEVAAFIQKCGNTALTVTPSPADCFVFGKDLGGSLTTQQEDSLREMQWTTLIALYLQKKNKIINAIYDSVAINSCQSFNDCIGNTSFNPFNKGFATTPSLYGSQYVNMNQPCSQNTRALFKYKQKRFLDESDMGADLNTIAYQLYDLTGQCPIAMNFQNLLNELANTGNLTATGLNLNSLSSASGLLIAMSNTNPALPFPSFTYDGVVTGNSLTITSTVDTTTSCQTVLTPVSGSINWNNVIGITGLTATGYVAPDYNFTAYVKVDDGNGGITLEEITGTTCLNILNCNFNQVCSPTELAEDLQVLLSVLANDGYLTSSSYALGTNPNYNPYITSNISALLTNTSNITWSLTPGPPLGVLSDGVNEIRLQFTSASTSSLNPAQINFFNNINVSSAGNNVYTVDVYDSNGLNLGTLTGTATKVINGMTSDLKMGSCENPPLSDCETPAHQNLDDLAHLLFFELRSDSFEIADLENIMESYAMTTGLQSYLGDTSVVVTATETTSCDTSGCSTLLSVMIGDCDLTLSFNTSDSISFEDIDPLPIYFTATGQLIQNNYFDFIFDVGYTNPNGVTDTITVTGSTTCIPLNNCDTCYLSDVRDTIVTGGGDTLVSDPIDKDTTLALMPTLEASVNDVNTRLGYTTADSAYIETPTYKKIMGKGAGAFVQNYIRFIENFNPTIDDSIYLYNFDMFIADFGKSLSIDNEYKRYVKTVELYNVRAANLSLDSIEIVNLEDYASKKLATGCNTYINHVDTCLQNDSTQAEGIIPFMVAQSMIDTSAVDSNQQLYKTYVEAYHYFTNNHPYAKYAESYLKMASYELTEKNNLYYNEFAKSGFTAYINTFYDTTLLPDVLPYYDIKRLRFAQVELPRCVQQYFQLVQLLNNYNSSAYAQLNNHQLPVPTPKQAMGLCDCLSKYMTYIAPYLEVPANQNLTLPLPIIRIEDGAEIFDCKATDPCEQAFANYQASVLEYNQMVADSNLTNKMITETVSAAAFEKRDLCNCVEKFSEAVAIMKDTIRSDSKITFASVAEDTTANAASEPPRELDPFYYCADIPCGPDSALIDTVPNDSVEYIDPCIQNMINTALANAANAYEQYIDSLSEDFITRYKERCTHYLRESFTKSYLDAEYHFTLYYFDQAGNLIKTIPPEGIEIVPTTSSLDALSQSILADRLTNTKNFYTNHRMETKYIYNSLNQLTKQTLPDHDNMDICTLSGVNGLPTNFRIEEAQFVTPSKGYLVGWLTQTVGSNPKDRGMLYTTNNGGANWTRINDVVAADINAMQWTTVDSAYAVGNNGVFLESKDAGFSWDMVNLYGVNVTENLNDLYLDASGNGLLVGDNLTLVDYQSGTPNKYNLTTSPSGVFDPSASITAVDFDATNNIYYITITDLINGENYVCYHTLANVNTPWTIIEDIRIDQLTAVSATDNNNAVVAGNDGLLLKTSDNGTNWIVTETGTREDFEHIYFRDANKGVAIINQSLYKTLDGGSSWVVMDNTHIYHSLNLYENDGTTARLMAACDNGTVVKVFVNASGAGHEPKVADATVPVVTLNDAYAVPNGSNLIVAAVSDDDLYVTHDFNANTPNWTKLDLTSSAPNLKQLRFVKGSGNHLMGLGIDNLKNVFEFEYDPNKDINNNPPDLDSTLNINSSITGFTDIDLLYNATNTFVLYNSSDNKMHEFVPTFGASAPTPSFGTFANSSSGTLPTPAISRLFSVIPNNDNILMIDTIGNIFELTAGTYNVTSTTTNNVRVEALNDVVVTQADSISAVTNNGKMLKGSNTLLTLKMTPALDNLNALDKLEVANNVLIAGDNGSLVLWNGSIFVTQNSGTTNNLLAIDKQESPSLRVMVTGAAGTILHTNNYTGGTYNSIFTSESGNINTVKYNSGAKSILGADQSHVLFGIAGTVLPTKQVFTDRLTGVHFSTINKGTVVGANYTARSTTNGGNSFGVILPTGGFTTAVPMELTAAHTANDYFIIGEQNYLGKATGNTATTVSLPAPSTNKLYDISLNSDTGFIVGGDAANKAVVYKTANGGSTWNNITVDSPTPPAFGGTINDATLLNMHHFTNNNTFIAVGEANTVVNYNHLSTNVKPIEITVTNVNSGNSGTVNLNDIDFYDNKLGYIVGDEGHLFRSTEVLWNNGSDLEITAVIWDEKSIADSTSVQLNDSLKDINTIAVASRFNAFMGGTYDASSNLGTYAQLLRDESNEISDKFFYDRLGRLVISQNSKQYGYSPKRYSYTIYDELGRIIEVGEKAENTTNTSFNDIFGTYIGATYNPNVIDDAKLLAWVSENSGSRTEITHTYYDKPLTGITAILPPTFMPDTNDYRNRIAMVSYEKVFDNDPLTYNHATHYIYDIHGNVKTLLQDNPDLVANSSTAPQRFKRMDYVYDLVSGNVNKVSYQSGEVDAWHHKYDYDADNRIQKVFVSDNDLIWSEEARYFYYDHGPLARIELGDNNVQGIDYAYTIQGWLKNMNSDELYAGNDMGQDGNPQTGNPNTSFARDAFGFSLHYYENDYEPIGTFTTTTLPVSAIAGSDVTDNSNDLFNGNIRAMVSTLKKPQAYTDSTAASLPELLPQATAYKYDQLNRLLAAAAFTNVEQDPLQGTFNQWQNSGTYNGRFFNQFTYDANGNILAQLRNDEDGNTFDDMIYQYAKDGNGNTVANRLYHVNDDTTLVHPNPPATGKNHFDDDIEDMGLFNNNLEDINDGSNNYQYDQIGNLIADKQEEIAKINWTVYGKVESVVRMASSLKKNLIFNYDANGNRIAKHQYGNMTPNSTQVNFDPLYPTDWEKSTYYSRDAQGNVMAIYEYTVVDSTQQNNYTLTERNIYGSNRLGNNNKPVEMIAAPPVDTSKYQHFVGYRQYELSNHLGNVMSVISDRKIARDTSANDTVDYYEPDVLLTFDYSPFGAPLHARSFSKEVCHDTTFTMTQEDLNTNFDDGTTQGWQALSTTPILSVDNNGRLRVQKQGGGSNTVGVQQSFMGTSGVVYDFSITIDNAFTSNSTIVLELIDPNNTIIYTQSLPKGNPPPNTATYNYQFTAGTTGSYVIKVYRTGPNSSGSFYMDDVLVTHEEEVTDLICDDYGTSGTGKYRYGFMNYEKDDEVSGAGNHLGFDDFGYDPRRVGRWNIDPAAVPQRSPYTFAQNSPIFFEDVEGETPRVSVIKNSRKSIRAQKRKNRIRRSQGQAERPIVRGTIVIENPVFVYSVDGNQNTAQGAVNTFSNPTNGVNSFIPGNSQYYDASGGLWAVKIKPLTFRAVANQSAAQAAVASSGGAGTIIAIQTGPAATATNPGGGVSNAALGGTNVNFWLGNQDPATGINNDGWAAGHEILHTFGFEDQYGNITDGTGAIIGQIEQPNFNPAIGNAPDIMGTPGAGLIQTQIFKIGATTTSLAAGTQVTPVVTNDAPNQVGTSNPPNLAPAQTKARGKASSKPISKRSAKRRARRSRRAKF